MAIRNNIEGETKRVRGIRSKGCVQDRWQRKYLNASLSGTEEYYTETAEAQTVTVGKIMQGKRLQISLEGHLLNQLHQIKYSFGKFHSDFCQDSVWTPLGIFSIKGCRGKYTS